MNIKLSYPFDLNAFQEFLPNVSLLTEEDMDSNTPIDLLIFPGGEDVTLNWYLDLENIKRYKGKCFTNGDRDLKERSILAWALKKDSVVNKIVGICRGAQFLNVCFGGVLFPDLPSAGIAHPRIHRIYSKRKHALSFIETVNSTHHQGIRRMGDYFGELGIVTNPKFLAQDENGVVVEMLTWLDDKVLGMQFHPEYYSEESSDKKKIREVLLKWIAGEINITG